MGKEIQIRLRRSVALRPATAIINNPFFKSESPTMSEEKQEAKENHVDSEEKGAAVVEDEKPDSTKDEAGQVNGDDDDESSDEELGSLEGPVKIIEGKRERKSTSRLSVEKPKEKAKEEEVIDYTQGKGMKLGDMEYVTWSIDGDSIDDLRPMHKLLYFTRKEPKNKDVRNDIKEFKGYPFDKDSKHFKSRHGLMYRFTIAGIRYVLNSLGMEWKKQVEGEEKLVNMEREEMINMLVDFLMEPRDIGKKIPTVQKPEEKKKTPARKTPTRKPSAEKKTPKSRTPKPKKEKKEKKTAVEDGENATTDETPTSPSKKKKTETKKKPTPVKIKTSKKTPG